MDPMTMMSLASMAAGLIGSLKKKKPANTTPALTNTLTPDQRGVSSQLTKILTQGGAKYGAPRVADMNSNEAYGQNFMRSALETARPGIDRQLSGEFPEQYFNQAIADPTRRQFNDRVAPVIKENSELTGNRFADRSAIEMGQARGDVESSILAERGKFGLETYRDPLNAATQLTGALNSAEALFSVPRTIEQAKLDNNFQEFLRTNPDSGGLIDAMLNFTNQGQNYATNPAAPEESIYPSLFTSGSSMLGSASMSNALQGGGSKSTRDRVLTRMSKPSYTTENYASA